MGMSGKELLGGQQEQLVQRSGGRSKPGVFEKQRRQVVGMSKGEGGGGITEWEGGGGCEVSCGPR